MEGELRVSVETVRQAIRRGNPGAMFDEEEPLHIVRTSLTFSNPPLPGEDFTGADLAYDARSQEFAFIVDDFCSWGGRLPKYNVPIDGALSVTYSVNPEEFPCLKDRAVSGRPVVLSPEDHVSLLSALRGVTSADHARGPEWLEDQQCLGFIDKWKRDGRVANRAMEAEHEIK
jgi:hypothetical protein